MEREIKFRMWNYLKDRPEKSRMFFDIENVMGCLQQQMVCNSGVAGLIGYNHISDGNVFMQYIGLKDKSDKEIYEGDIMKGWWSDGATVIVVYKNGSACYEYTNKDNSKEIFLLEKSYCEESEVIGNIYENPELLNK